MDTKEFKLRAAKARKMAIRARRAGSKEEFAGYAKAARELAPMWGRDLEYNEENKAVADTVRQAWSETKRILLANPPAWAESVTPEDVRKAGGRLAGRLN